MTLYNILKECNAGTERNETATYVSFCQLLLKIYPQDWNKISPKIPSYIGLRSV